MDIKKQIDGKDRLPIGNESLCSATLHYRLYWFDWFNHSDKYILVFLVKTPHINKVIFN